MDNFDQMAAIEAQAGRLTNPSSDEIRMVRIELKLNWIIEKLKIQNNRDCEVQPEVYLLGATVDNFSVEMKEKLIKKYNEGRTGWDDKNWPIEEIKELLIDHVKKGDFVDVANFAMFAWNKTE